MDLGTVDKQLATLRDEEGVLQAQLHDLDTRLETWIAAMRAAQRSVAERSAAVTPTAGNAGAGAADEAGPQPVAEPAATPVAEVEEAVATASPAPPPEPSVSVDVVEEPPATEPAADVTEVDPTPESTTPDESTDATTGAEDDEALLATLDPQVANQIRVKRRLTGNKRSVRELLNELGADAGGVSKTEGKPARGKRWWR